MHTVTRFNVGWIWFNETGLFRDGEVSIMAVDASACCVISTTMVLNMQYKRILIFCKKFFQLHQHLIQR